MKNKIIFSVGLFAAATAVAAHGAPMTELQELTGSEQARAAQTTPTPVSTPAPGPSAADLAPITTISQLLTRDGEALKALYQRSQPGAIPVGESEGMASVAPGTDEGEESRRFFSFLWQGKVFVRSDDGTTTLVNKTFLGESFAAKVYVGPSLLDGKDSIIIDYKDTPFKPFQAIRDEIRQAAPGIYLGYAYLRGIDYAPIVFALNFNAPPERPLPQHMP